jgi:hypothetical protein
LAVRGTAALAGLVVLATALLFVGSASARPAWGKPFELTKPGSLDYLDPQLAFSPQGAAAAAFRIGDVDQPGSSRAYLVSRSAQGKVGQPKALAGVNQVLSLAYDGRPLELLVGSSPSNQDCCSTAEAIQVSPSGAAGRARKLVGGLAGATQGRLVKLADGQLMAAVGTERGVWVVQATRGDRFGAPHIVSDKGQEPVSMSAAWLGGQTSIVAWTAGTGVIGATTPRSIYYATGSRKQAPHHARVAVTVPAGHRIDELAVVRRGNGATLVWIESWFDKHGAYHSRVEAADLAKQPRIRALSPDNRLASGLTVDDDAGGDQGAAWESCTSSDSCTVQAAGRPAQGTFGSARTLGAIDAYQTPTLTVSPKGQALVGWVRGGHPVASVGFGSPAVLSSTIFATDETVAYGPKNEALAAWTQGTLNPSVVAAAFRAK